MLELVKEIQATETENSDSALIALSEVQLVLIGGGCGVASLD